ncbi:ABC transporter-associated protein EcsC [Pullulanibacillus camelliae]|uniref:ABC transporter-associated protein EcsC n=1 Tax=Pullulanibacillus camelliae TaxID=1707096 RepID=A0A8J2VPQ4_9BACL|nr:EcsC family protein [Pullulanibacillus camelliae]GGE37244.1 ABC transporter-associated protein EcsC [Pullulanibacillus camelliae]
MNYKEYAEKECLEWQQKMLKSSGVLGRAAKNIQTKINKKIPQQVHTIVTESIKKMIQAVLLGSKWTSKKTPLTDVTLAEREDRVRARIKVYKRIAAAEGAGTGAGGFWLGIADFPALLSIKMKLLFDIASLYGYDVKDYRERLYILHIFQVAFSSDATRKAAFMKLKHWNETVKDFPSEATHLNQLDWQSLQQEYRDYIDLPKLLQMIPGIGAAVGFVVNYRFLDSLGETAMNAYRMRLLEV